MPSIDPNFFLYRIGEQASVAALEGIVDGFPSVTHTQAITTSTAPLETGGSLTDHAVIEPKELTLTGWVSDLVMPQAAMRPALAWEIIKTVAEAREVISIVTTWNVYDNMLITSFSATEDRTRGRSMKFTIKLREVLIVGQRAQAVGAGTSLSVAADRSSLIDAGDKILEPFTITPQGLDESTVMDAVKRLTPDELIRTPSTRSVSTVLREGHSETIARRATTFVRDLTRLVISVHQLDFQGVTTLTGLQACLRSSLGQLPLGDLTSIRSIETAIVNATHRLPTVPLTLDARQTFRVVMGGQQTRVRTWWQPSSEGWYLSLTGSDNHALVNGARLTPDAFALTATPAFTGNLKTEALSEEHETTAIGREAWGRTHRLVYQELV